MPLIRQTLDLAVFMMLCVIFASVIISWLRMVQVRIPYGNPLIRAIEATAEAMLRPIREHLPVTGGGFDFSPMIAIMILYALRSVIVRL